MRQTIRLLLERHFGLECVKGLYTAVILSCAAAHLLLLILLSAAQSTYLLITHSIGIAVCLFGIYALHKNWERLAITLLHAEIFCYYAAMTVTTGDSLGVEYQLIGLLILEGNLMFRHRLTPVLLRFFAAALLVAGKVYAVTLPPPWMGIPPAAAHAAAVLNLSLCLLAIAFSSVLYSHGSSTALCVLKTKARHLEYLAKTDPLTELPNRRWMDERLHRVLTDSLLSKRPFCVAMCDIDNFKRINDSCGHAGGDYVLKSIAGIVQDYFEQRDIVCRWGGEEILLLLEGMDIKEALRAVNGLRAQVEATAFSYNHQTLRVTMTMGLAQYREGTSVEDLVLESDRLMYKGKQHGKNRVVYPSDQ